MAFGRVVKDGLFKYSTKLTAEVFVSHTYSIMVFRCFLVLMLVLGGGASDYHLPPG